MRGSYVASIRLDSLRMNGKQRLDFLTLEIWSRAFWLPITWNLHSWSKIVLRSTSPALPDLWLLLYYTSLSVTTWLQLSATGHTLRPVVNRSPLGKNQLSNWKTKLSRANRSTAYKNLYCCVSVAQVPEAIYWWFYCLSTFDKNVPSTETECRLRQNLEKINWGV